MTQIPEIKAFDLSTMFDLLVYFSQFFEINLNQLINYYDEFFILNSRFPTSSQLFNFIKSKESSLYHYFNDRHFHDLFDSEGRHFCNYQNCQKSKFICGNSYITCIGCSTKINSYRCSSCGFYNDRLPSKCGFMSADLNHVYHDCQGFSDLHFVDLNTPNIGFPLKKKFRYC